VIVGGGYAGVTLARALDEAFDVVLLERRDRFYHNVGAMRGYANASFFERLLIPYDRLLRRGRVVQDEAVSAEGGGVRGVVGRYEGDAVVVASGSRHRMPFKSSYTEAGAILREAGRLSAELAEAESVEVCGDGPVAVELAGEIRWRYPKKAVTLVVKGERLLAGTGNPRLGERAAVMLREMGVRVAYGGVGTGAGLRIAGYGAEFSVPCLGAERRVPVDDRFRVAGREGVFAIGDAADCGEPALTFLARRQALHLAGQFLGKKAGYGRAGRVPMSVPLGPERGVTQLPLPGLPVAGSWVTARLKGRRLFVAENWERMGFPTVGS
jgi:NADH dehydrogenase FAD-containing subunit